MSLEQIQNQLSDLQSKFDSLIEETLLTTKMASDIVRGDFIVDPNKFTAHKVIDLRAYSNGDFIEVLFADEHGKHYYCNHMVLIQIKVKVFSA